jgi:hypothetical protein
LNHGQFFDQERIVYENLTTKKTIKVIELDHYYSNWNRFITSNGTVPNGCQLSQYSELVQIRLFLTQSSMAA